MECCTKYTFTQSSVSAVPRCVQSVSGPVELRAVSADVWSVMETRGSLQVIMRRQERSRSPVSVHEWVAALPDIDKDAESEERTEERDSDIAEDDNLTLGAEGESLLTF